MNRESVWKNVEKVAEAIAAAFALFFVFGFVSIFVSLDINGDKYSFIVMVIYILTVMIVIAALWGFLKKKLFYIPICVAFGLCVVSWVAIAGYQNYLDNIPTVGEGNDFLNFYAPYAENSKAVTLDEESRLKIEENIPVMDGATALYPIFSSFAKAVYPKELIEDIKQVRNNDYLKCNTTTKAYHNIVTGEADIIFAALPSEEQKQFAKENGVELVYTPIGKEAFVFFVNSKNPIDDISIEEIQKIYSGEITQWEELGIKGFGDIKAFQRDKGSGSQSTLEKLMAGQNLMTPPKENVIDGMGGIIEQTADYKNFKNAIGYSFRFYSTEMVTNNNIKLLSVNGVYPSLENIENGKYQLASYFYAVTRSDADENVLKLLEWITGEQGQKIIEMSGYTPLGN